MRMADNESYVRRHGTMAARRPFRFFAKWESGEYSRDALRARAGSRIAFIARAVPSPVAF